MSTYMESLVFHMYLIEMNTFSSVYLGIFQKVLSPTLNKNQSDPDQSEGKAFVKTKLNIYPFSHVIWNEDLFL